MYIVCARLRIGVGRIATAKVNNGQGVTARPGARFGPSGIRQGSSRISPDAAWSIYTGMSYYHEGARMGVHPASTDLERCSKQSNNERHLLHHAILASCVLLSVHSCARIRPVYPNLGCSSCCLEDAAPFAPA